MSDLISRQAAIEHIEAEYQAWGDEYDVRQILGDLEDLPSAQPEGWVKIPDTGIDDLSDGFHTFRQLYYQRMILFATIVRQNREKAWKSLRHEDGELCFGGGWFIVGIDTPEGSYTYHYEDNFYSLFDCKELECAKHWDGHTEKDVTRLLSLPSAQSYTEAEIQKMQDLEQAELAKAFELGKQDAQSEQRWIPVDEEKPKDGTDCLVTYSVTYGNGRVEIATFAEDLYEVDEYNFHDKVGVSGWFYFDDEYGYLEYSEVIAWMPLPEPYRSET